MRQEKCPGPAGGCVRGGDEEAVLTTSIPMVPCTGLYLRLRDLDSDDYDIRHQAARDAWAIVCRLNAERCEALHECFGGDPPRSPGWKIATLARLRLWQLQQRTGIPYPPRCCYCDRRIPA